MFVEKPLALTSDELDRILATVDATGNDRVMVGFNRRFAPLLVEMRERFGRSSEPTNARYLVNAGRLGSDSWYRDSELEGSRFVGEGGHFVDTMSWWIGSDPVEVMAMAGGRCRRGASEPSLRRRVAGDCDLPDERAPKVPQRDFRGLERRANGSARQFQASHRLVGYSRHASVGTSVRPTRVRPREIKAFIDAVRTRWTDADLPRVARGHDPRHAGGGLSCRDSHAATTVNPPWRARSGPRDEFGRAPMATAATFEDVRLRGEMAHL